MKIKVRLSRYVKIRGTDAYRARTDAELQEAASRALARREAVEQAKTVELYRSLGLSVLPPTKH